MLGNAHMGMSTTSNFTPSVTFVACTHCHNFCGMSHYNISHNLSSTMHANLAVVGNCYNSAGHTPAFKSFTDRFQFQSLSRAATLITCVAPSPVNKNDHGTIRCLHAKHTYIQDDVHCHPIFTFVHSSSHFASQHNICNEANRTCPPCQRSTAIKTPR